MNRERDLRSAGYMAIAGLDEAGRGPLAGPVTAGAAILPAALHGDWVDLVRDSKQLTAAQRESVLPKLVEAAVAISTGSASAVEIDELGIVPAVRLAMSRALEGLSVAPDYLLLDAFPLPGSDLPQMAIVKGDAVCTSVAAASIAAKVDRDRVMRGLDEEFPGYGFAAHKGYGSAAHMEALGRLGPCEVHRITFAPVRAEATARDLFADRLRRLVRLEEAKEAAEPAEAERIEEAVAPDTQPGLPGLRSL